MRLTNAFSLLLMTINIVAASGCEIYIDTDKGDDTGASGQTDTGTPPDSGVTNDTNTPPDTDTTTDPDPVNLAAVTLIGGYWHWYAVGDGDNGLTLAWGEGSADGEQHPNDSTILTIYGTDYGAYDVEFRLDNGIANQIPCSSAPDQNTEWILCQEILATPAP